MRLLDPTSPTARPPGPRTGWWPALLVGAALGVMAMQVPTLAASPALALGAVVLALVALLYAAGRYRTQRRAARAALRSRRDEEAAREAAQTARHQAALLESERRFHSAFTHASIGMALVAFDGHILQANTALAQIVGATGAGELAERELAALFAESEREALTDNLRRIAARQAASFQAEMRCGHRQGGELWVTLHGAVFIESDADAPCLIVQMQDVSARRHAQAQLNHIAFHDGLTGLPNRTRFHDALVQALAHLRQDPDAHFAVMFIDFDRFKLINDSMGHSVGDAFLIQVSRRIQDQVRPGDVLARLGGDEFALLMRQVRDESAATQLADRLQAVLGQPLQVGGVNVGTSASIGITFSRLGYESPEQLLRDADIAMYRAKAGGKARYALFDARLHTEVADRMRLEADLRQALAEGALDLAYQPLFHIGSGQLRGFEALARWQHPTRGAIPPGVFIPIAEDAGLIIELSNQVLARACGQIRQWQQRDERLAELKLQVNLSGADLADEALHRRVESVLRRSGLEPRLLTLELTENILMLRVDSATRALESLRRLGVVLAIDDFGTGYSSLSYLSTLPIDSLKIDQSFVHGMRVAGSKEAEIVRAIVSLGSSLGKTVVAEGIESQSQLMQLHALGCEHGQGFHLSRPLAVPEAEALLDFLTVEPQDSRLRLHDSGMMPLMRH
jgi:diguanylate cyclase (GGDEF)-like protein/PAS domain S-box-containing protein